MTTTQNEDDLWFLDFDLFEKRIGKRPTEVTVWTHPPVSEESVVEYADGYFDIGTPPPDVLEWREKVAKKISAVESADRLEKVRPRRWKGREQLYDLMRDEYEEQSKLHPEWPSRKLCDHVARAARVRACAAQLGITLRPRTVRTALSKKQKV